MRNLETIPITPSRPDNTDGLSYDATASSRKAQVANILRQNSVAELGAEYRLFIHLLLVAEGSLIGDYEQIGKNVQTAGRNIQGWAKKLEETGMITIEGLRHKQKHIQLTEPYLTVATMEEAEAPAQPQQSDPYLEKLITTYRTAKETGQTIRVETVLMINDK